MATRKQFLIALAHIPGATFDEDALDGAINVYSPKGFMFPGIGHNLVAIVYHPDTGKSCKGDAYTDLIERMSYGIIPCTDPNCDHCHDEEIP